MFHKKLLITLVVFAAAGSAAALAPGRSDGSANAPRTIALITRDGAAGFVEPFETGGQSAATTLGDQLTIATADDPVTEISTIKSLVAEHVAAIAIDTRDPATVKQVLPALAKARAAGVPTLSYETRFPGSPWVNLTSPTQFVHALAERWPHR